MSLSICQRDQIPKGIAGVHSWVHCNRRMRFLLSRIWVHACRVPHFQYKLAERSAPHISGPRALGYTHCSSGTAQFTDGKKRNSPERTLNLCRVLAVVLLVIHCSEGGTKSTSVRAERIIRHQVSVASWCRETEHKSRNLQTQKGADSVA